MWEFSAVEGARQMVQEASSNGTFGRMGIVGGGAVLTQKARITQA